MLKKLTPTQTRLIASTFVTTRIYMNGSGETNAAKNLYTKGYVKNWYPICQEEVTEKCKRAFFDDNGRTFWVNDQSNSFLIFHDYQLYAIARSADFAEKIVEALKSLPLARSDRAERKDQSDQAHA